MQYRLGSTYKNRKFEASSIFSIQSEPKSSRRGLKVHPEDYSNRISHIPDLQSPNDQECSIQEKRFSFKNIDRSETIMKMLAPEEQTIPRNFEDGRVSKIEYKKFQIIEASIALFALVGIFLTIFAVDF